MKLKLLLLTISCISFTVFHSHCQPRKQRSIQKIINRATEKALPGVTVYVRTAGHDEWIGVSGFADVENKEPLTADHIFAIGSISKTYCAVGAIKLAEQGYLTLDDKIGKFLPAETISNLPNGNQITIRHLLANTSGIYNYEFDPELNRLYLSGKLKLDTLTHIEVLRRYVYGKPADCLPGTAYHYSSTNFMLLAMIMDKIAPQGHTNYFRDLVASHDFNNTFYRENPPARLVKHYGDLNQDGVIEDLTAKTIETTNWFIGDDGIYASVSDAAHFLELVLRGKTMLTVESLTQMTTWNDNKKPDYGLGLMADKSFPYKFLMGHSGRGIGTTTDLFYFPKQDITVGIFCNMGLRGSAPEFKKAYLKMRNKIVKRLFLI